LRLVALKTLTSTSRKPGAASSKSSTAEAEVGQVCVSIIFKATLSAVSVTGNITYLLEKGQPV
jgi:hypothetical protein